MLLANINLENKEFVADGELLNKIKIIKPKLLLTLGAGDIDRFVEPLKEILT